METTAASPPVQHPIRLVVTDDLQRTRLTVFDSKLSVNRI